MNRRQSSEDRRQSSENRRQSSEDRRQLAVIKKKRKVGKMGKKIESWEGVEQGLSALARLKARVGKVEAALSAKAAMLRQRAEEKTFAEREEIAELTAGLEAFSLRNKAYFAEVRTREFTNGVIGFRTNPPKVNRLNGKQKWEDILDKLDTVLDGAYVRVKKDVAKDEILSDYKNGKVSDGALASVGMRIDNDETFILEVKQDSIQKADSKEQKAEGRGKK